MTAAAGINAQLRSWFRDGQTVLNPSGLTSSLGARIWLPLLWLEQLHALITTGLFGAGEVILRSFVGVGMVALCLWLIRVVVGKSPVVHGVVTFLLLAGLGLVRAVAYLVTGVASEYVWQISLQSILFTIVSGLITGVVVARLHHFQDSIAAVNHAARQLEAQRVATAAAIDEVQAVTDEWVARTIRPQLDDAERALSSLESASPDLPAVTAALRQSAEVVRVQSHRLSELPLGTEVLQSVAESGPRVRESGALTGYWRRWVTGRPILPVAVPILSLAISSSTVFQIGRQWPWLLVSTVVQLAFLFASLPLMTVIRRLPTRWAGFVVLLVYACSGVVFCVPEAVRVHDANPWIAAWLIFLTLMAVTLVGLMVSMAVALLQLLRVNETTAHSYLQSAHWELARYQATLRNAKQALQNTIHTEVQGRLAYSALALDDAASRGPEAVGPTVELCRQAIRDSWSEVQEAAQVIPLEHEVSLSRALQDLVTTWQPLIDISLALQPSDPPEADLTPEASAQLVYATGEAIANAVRHGCAHKVEVNAAVGGFVTVDDDGIGLSPGQAGSEPGLTRQSFLAAGGTWKFATSPLGGTRTSLSLPAAG